MRKRERVSTHRHPEPEGTPRRVELNRVAKDELVALLGGYAKFADTLIGHRPYERPEDLLRVRELHRLDWAWPLVFLIVNGRGSASGAPPAYPAPREEYRHPSGIRYGVRGNDPGGGNVFIAHPLGVDLVSADLNRDGGGVDYASLRWLSHSPSDLMALDAQTLEIAHSVLHSEPALHAGFLWRESLEEIADPRVRDGIDHLSQNLRGLQDFTQERQPPHPETDWLTNGCTKVPNFDFVECCKKHDICYSDKGSDTLGRLQCDWDLLKCIASNSLFFPLAVVYFIGVRVMGPAVSTGEAIVPVGPRPSFIPPPTFDTIRRCTYVIKVLSVSYFGDDIDKDEWELEFGTDPEHVEARVPPFKMKLGRTYQINGGQGVQVYNSEQHGDQHWCFDEIESHHLWINVPGTPVGKLFFLKIPCCPAVVPYELVLPVTLDGSFPLFKRGTAKLRCVIEVHGRCRP